MRIFQQLKYFSFRLSSFLFYWRRTSHNFFNFAQVFFIALFLDFYGVRFSSIHISLRINLEINKRKTYHNWLTDDIKITFQNIFVSIIFTIKVCVYLNNLALILDNKIIEGMESSSGCFNACFSSMQDS